MHFSETLALVLVLCAACRGAVDDPGAGTDGGVDARIVRDDGGVAPDGAVADAGDLDGGPPISRCDTFEATALEAAAAKVKMLATGMPLTAAERMGLADPSFDLPAATRGWLATPEADAKLLGFLRTYFQQEGFAETGLIRQLGVNNINFGRIRGVRTNEALMENLEDSVARTVLARRDQPLSDMATTDTFMMTTAMMITLAFMDEHIIDDEGDNSFRNLRTELNTITYQDQAAVALDDLIDPGHASFLRFYAPQPNILPQCAKADGELTQRVGNGPVRVFELLFGRFRALGNSRVCRSRTRISAPLLTEADFEDWRMVRVRRPASGEAPTKFYRVDQLRATNELVLETPRVGFFSAPAFFSLWETNEDNQARVTLNQTLITAFGQSIDGDQTIIPIVDDALDAEHAGPGTVCFGCHSTLDPMRQFFRRDYTVYYSQQLDTTVRAQAADFAWDGVTGGGGSIEDFAALVGSHPNWAPGWTQKACFYMTGEACPGADPELLRVTEAFRASGLKLDVLFEELLTSPLVTGLSCVEDGHGGTASLARARHFCAALSGRLGVADACGLESVWPERTPADGLRNSNRAFAQALPNDQMSRGDADPVTITDPSLFMRGAYERICYNTAVRWVEGALDGVSGDTDPARVAPDWVETLMGVPPTDPRHDALVDVLTDHHADAVSEGATPGVALRSTFIVACTNPSLMAVGL